MPSNKVKGGKPVAGVSAAEEAAKLNSAGIAEAAANPVRFPVITVVEDVGILKGSTSTDYMLNCLYEGVVVEVIVPRAFVSKSGKLLLPEMGVVGTRLVSVSKTAIREKEVATGISPGPVCMRKKMVSVIERSVMAVLPA
jgi:hypothetical protein